MLGKLTFDKASMNISLFLYSIKVVFENGGQISRKDFTNKLACKIGVSAYIEDESGKKENRTPYNKSKMARYFGFITSGLNENGEDVLRITQCGKVLYEYIKEHMNDEDYKTRFFLEDSGKDIFSELIMQSLLFNTFGKNNCGAEQSCTDLETPKIIFKILKLLENATTSEIFYIIYGLNFKEILTLQEGIKNVRYNREKQLNNYSTLFNRWNVRNKINDCKIIKIFANENINLVDTYRDEDNNDVYSLSQRTRKSYLHYIDDMNEFYEPKQLVFNVVGDDSKAYNYIYNNVLGTIDKNNIIKCDSKKENDIIKMLNVAIINAIAKPNKNVYFILENILQQNIEDMLGEYKPLFERIKDHRHIYNGESINRVSLVNKSFEKRYLDIFAKKGGIFFPTNLNIVITITLDKGAKMENILNTFKQYAIEDTNSDSRFAFDKAWYVGATGHDEDGVYTDFSDKYIQEGIWINGYNNKYIDKVKNVCAGDRIALKASFTKKNGLPFDTNGKTVGVMGIKAIGTVVENIGDGKNLKVEWVKLDNVKYWYGAGVLRNTIHYIDGTVSLIKQALLDFTFGNGTQDYELCEQQYLDDEEVSVPESFKTNDPYDKNMFLNEVFMNEADYNTLKELVDYKKNIILQGAPGVGKTFLAKRFAYSLMGEKDEDRVGFVQFHQNYSYEDFIQGYRPKEDGFKLTDGVFYKFCKKAEKSNKSHYFIIDEINRGNLSKIFGELMMLVESDKRGDSATLVYSGIEFCVPKNIYIIGMMNTADRSLAIMDYALRRRFSFFEIEPAFGNIKFKTHLTSNGIDNQTMDKIIKKFSELNGYIANEKESGLGKGFQIGHSYFCGKPNCSVDKWYDNIMKYEISPILYEYWFDEEDKAKEWLGKLV